MKSFEKLESFESPLPKEVLNKIISQINFDKLRGSDDSSGNLFAQLSGIEGVTPIKI